MQKTNEWGSFFPASLSPFPYEETVAHYYFPKIKKEEVPKSKNTQKQVISDEISKNDNSVLTQILNCEDCKKPYKIQLAEYKFYQKMNIPIPLKCSNCRHEERMNLRSKRQLFLRKCSKCSVDIQSVFSDTNSLKIFCEQCFLKLME